MDNPCIEKYKQKMWIKIVQKKIINGINECKSHKEVCTYEFILLPCRSDV